jgi:hypothetical protein
MISNKGGFSKRQEQQEGNVQMKDSEFETLELKATIVPTQARWHEPKVLHWQKLHAAADEARDRVAQTWAAMDEIENDADLSSEGKTRQKKKLALEALGEFENSKTLAAAKQTVDRQLDKWAEKTGLAVKAPTNIAEAVIQSEIRAHVAAMKEGRLGFLEKHATDPVVASAVLGAPSFLSGLNETESTFVKQRIEKHVAPEIADARDATLKAMKELEAGWQRAMDKIGERAGLTKGADGTWTDASRSVAA